MTLVANRETRNKSSRGGHSTASGKYWRGGQKRRGRGNGDYNVNESRPESFLPEKKEKLRRQDRETSEESSRWRSRDSREKKPRSKERKGYLLRDSPSPTHNNPREHISRKTAHYKETWWEENEEALRGWKKVSPHFLPSTSGSSEPQLGAEESRSSSLAPLPQHTLQKPTPMKEEPKEDMEDASNVPSTSGMATLPVERFIKEERVHEMEEAWYAPPRPPRPFNWTPYPPVPFFESQNVNLDDISDQEDEMEDVTPAQEWIEKEERNDERELEEAETPVLDAEPEEENHPEEDEIRDEEADVAEMKRQNVKNDKPPRQQPPPPSRRQPPPASASAATLPRKTIITEARDYFDEDDDKATVEETERKQRALAEREAKIREQVIRQMREASTPPGTPSPFVEDDEKEKEEVGAEDLEEAIREVRLVDEVKPKRQLEWKDQMPRKMKTRKPWLWRMDREMMRWLQLGRKWMQQLENNLFIAFFNFQ